jgi:tetratricopeptide (TPR) repeat protein
MKTAHLPAATLPSHYRRSHAGGKTLLAAALVSLASLLAPPAGAEDAPAWAGTAKTAPQGLLELALTKRGALFFTEQAMGAGALHVLGCFIGADGLALCPLTPLSWQTVPVFHLTDEGMTALPQPVVLAVFPEQEVALLQFKHKPKTWLTLAKEPPSVGTWLAMLIPSFAADPVLGPIVAFREMSWSSPLLPPRQPVKKFSLAVGRSPKINAAFVQGAPMMDAQGDLVATFSGSQTLPGQTLRTANSLAPLHGQVQQAAKTAKSMALPLSAKDLQLDPAVLSVERLAMGEAGAAAQDGRFDEVMQQADRLIAKFPDSTYVKDEYFAVASIGIGLGKVKAEELVRLAQQFKLPEDAPAWQKGAYYCRLGEALMRANRMDDAIAPFQKADELWPHHMACMSLAEIYGSKGRLDEAERYWRRTTSLDQERIEYWNRLNLVLSARLKFEEASEVSDRALFLETLYRSR